MQNAWELKSKQSEVQCAISRLKTQQRMLEIVTMQNAANPTRAAKH
jgi:hypothetical protein